MLRKLILGVVPWIVFSLVLRFGSADVITFSWITFFILHTYFGREYLKAFNVLSWVSSLTFVVLFINSLTGWSYWALQYGAQICYGVFAFTAFASVLAKKPFTITHSKMNTPEEFWGHPMFLAINNMVSLYWAMGFAVNGIVLMFEYQLPWASLITTYMVLASAIVFSDWYPKRAQQKAMQMRAAAQQQAVAQ